MVQRLLRQHAGLALEQHRVGRSLRQAKVGALAAAVAACVVGAGASAEERNPYAEAELACRAVNRAALRLSPDTSELAWPQALRSKSLSEPHWKPVDLASVRPAVVDRFVYEGFGTSQAPVEPIARRRALIETELDDLLRGQSFEFSVADVTLAGPLGRSTILRISRLTNPAYSLRRKWLRGPKIRESHFVLLRSEHAEIPENSPIEPDWPGHLTIFRGHGYIINLPAGNLGLSRFIADATKYGGFIHNEHACSVGPGQKGDPR
jgi:hypothetical protein